MARILAVDDDPSILALERILLTEEGHEVLLASTARAGVDLLKLYKVDLIIADIMMPEVNGFQFINLIRNNPKIEQMPIAFLTSKSDKQDVVRAGEMGADFYIMKPLVPDEFVKKIKSFFEKNPPLEHSQVAFQNTIPVEAKITISGQILMLSDMGVEIRTESQLELDQVVQLSSSIFHEIPMRHPLLSVSSIHPEGRGLSRVKLMFVEQDRDTVLRLQRWILYSKLKRKKVA